ncbi:hypothetical protein BC829DRAFT_401385 [Chytridium lagenaria]|nr:hypothetical protein BC829DRAFT_401385 [Chytridium lagenaria]
MIQTAESILMEQPTPTTNLQQTDLNEIPPSILHRLARKLLILHKHFPYTISIIHQHLPTIKLGGSKSTLCVEGQSKALQFYLLGSVDDFNFEGRLMAGSMKYFMNLHPTAGNVKYINNILKKLNHGEVGVYKESISCTMFTTTTSRTPNNVQTYFLMEEDSSLNPMTASKNRTIKIDIGNIVLVPVTISAGSKTSYLNMTGVVYVIDNSKNYSPTSGTNIPDF